MTKAATVIIHPSQLVKDIVCILSL